MTVLSNLSLILLAVEAFVVALIPLVLCGGLVYGLWWLQRHENLPTWLQLARAYLSLALAYVEMGMALVARPILSVHSNLATAQGWLGAMSQWMKGDDK
ncbi:MAG TPA: hypothetical protein ENN99_09890 [Chloroflexi bacterium]|nr:hypothetical protein [Chloroflexota bacterium]